ncbi:MAG: siroheme synthase [Alphaproteobacteria bacterium]|nr:siroheme synthase [Alphaproteobacteria bacterium]
MRRMSTLPSSQRRYLPISYDVAGRRVAVVGNGAAALAKLEILLATQARLTLFAPAPRLDLATRLAGVEWVASYPDGTDLAGIALLFLATEDEAEDRRLADLARSLGIPVNVVDRPLLGSFAMPSIVERGPLTVAIASDGTAPVLAQRVRGLIDALLPAGLANLGELARAVRANVLARLPGNAARRRFWWRTFDGSAGAAALSGDLERARSLALRDLDAPEHARAKVFFVEASEADLLTLRGQRLLLCADTIVHDPGAPADVLAIGRRDAARLPAGGDASPLLIRLARSGRQIVRLNGPQEEANALPRAGIDCEVVPGATAVGPLASPSIAA